jgi:acyl-coenzyme A thioesterase PaaI-like protein
VSPDPEPPARSAAELGRALGDALPTVDSVRPADLELAEAARCLLDAVVRTDVDEDERARVAAELRRLGERLGARSRADLVRLVRHPEGRIENLVQAGAGRLNPRGLRLHVDDATLPPDGVVVPDAEARGWCTLDASATGPPGRAHGGIVATILDEALGWALMRAGRTGMTVVMEVSYQAAVPIGVELDVRARCVAIDGRKTTIEAELRDGEQLLARAQAIFVASR